MGNIISFLRVSLGLDNSKFKAGLKTSEKQTKSFGKTMSGVFANLGIALGLREILRVGAEMVKLAGEAEGVERAFDRIGGAKVFDSLKTATRGTVSNLELMRKAVMAQNLGVPVEKLAKLLEFAAARAADTGASVDYLSESIVTGIGRKSSMILDNLGISAVELKENLNGVGLGTASVGQVAEAVEKIADKALKNMGNSATTAGQKIQSLGASWDNVKLSIGRVITTAKEYAIVSDLVFGLDMAFNKADNSQKKLEEGAKRIFESFKKNGKISKEDAAARIKALTDENKELLTNGDLSNKNVRDRRKGNIKLIRLLKAVSEAPSEGIIEEVANIENLSKKIENLQTDQKTATGSRLMDINREIAALNEQIKALKKLGTEIKSLPRQEAIDVSILQGGLDTKALSQTVKNDPIKLPVTLTTEGTFGDSSQSQQQILAAQQAASLAASQDIATDAINRTTEASMAYGSILGSVGQIAAASGDQQVATMLNVAATTLTAIAAIIPALFAKGTAEAAAAGAGVPFPGNIIAIAAGVAAVASVFSGIGGGGVSSGGGSVTSIDTRGFTSPTTSDGSTRISTQRQAVDVNVTGTIKGKDIALANNQGQKQLKR
jgi:hypothetical protein